MADPVSWFLIEPGWRVEDANGSELGRVLEVVGDSNADIFDGLAIAFSALAKPRYVAAEQVAEIVEGTVRLNVSRDAAEQLTEYEEPPVEEEIEPDRASAVSRIETKVVSPPTRPSDLPLLRRILLWFGLTGRR